MWFPYLLLFSNVQFGSRSPLPTVSLSFSLSHYIKTRCSAGKELRLALPTKRLLIPDFLLLHSKSDKDHYLDSFFFLLLYFTLRNFVTEMANTLSARAYVCVLQKRIFSAFFLPSFFLCWGNILKRPWVTFLDRESTVQKVDALLSKNTVYLPC